MAGNSCQCEVGVGRRMRRHMALHGLQDDTGNSDQGPGGT